MFSGCTVQPGIKETKFGSSNHEVFTLRSKNTEIDLVPCPTRKCVSAAIFAGIDLSEVSGCHLLQQMSSQ